MFKEKERRIDDAEILTYLGNTYKGVPHFKCSICGGFFAGYGNNPYPVTKDDSQRCCDACNREKVIPARIHALMHKEVAK